MKDFARNQSYPASVHPLNTGWSPPALGKPSVVDRLSVLVGRVKGTVALRLHVAVLALLGYSRTGGLVHLPMGSGVYIMPNTSAEITSRPQDVGFRPERIVIGGAPGDWVVNDVKIGTRSQFSQSGDVPGEAFAYDASGVDGEPGLRLKMDVVPSGCEVRILVTYVGKAPAGAPFVSTMLGTVLSTYDGS